MIMLKVVQFRPSFIFLWILCSRLMVFGFLVVLEDLTTASPTVPISQNFTLNEEDGGENGSHTADVEAQLGDAMMTTGKCSVCLFNGCSAMSCGMVNHRLQKVIRT